MAKSPGVHIRSGGGVAVVLGGGRPAGIRRASLTRLAFAVASLTRPEAPTSRVRLMADLKVLQLERSRDFSPAIVCLPGVVVAEAALLPVR